MIKEFTKKNTEGYSPAMLEALNQIWDDRVEKMNLDPHTDEYEYQLNEFSEKIDVEIKGDEKMNISIPIKDNESIIEKLNLLAKLTEENEAKYEKLSKSLDESIDIMNSAKEITPGITTLNEAIQLLAIHDALITIAESYK